jgi:hypothetical protein
LIFVIIFVRDDSISSSSHIAPEPLAFSPVVIEPLAFSPVVISSG